MLPPYLGLNQYQLYTERALKQERSILQIEFWDRHRELLRQLLELGSISPQLICDQSGIIKAGCNRVSAEQISLLERIVEGLIPWRKGPFSLCGVHIDAEWRADKKWDRIRPALRSIEGKKVADVGCNNGYYMLRMLSECPQLVVGFDPNARFYYQFDLIRRLTAIENVYYELLGIEDLDLFQGFFDTVLCMGVIYHRRDPYQALQNLRDSLKPGGQLILESLATPGQEPHCLCPIDRYGKMRNVWYVPSEGCLCAWLVRSGYIDIEVVSRAVLTFEEQRKTALAPYESLDDFLDPNNPMLTVEGYPAPLRIALSACRPC